MCLYRISHRFEQLTLLVFSLLSYFVIQPSCFIKMSPQIYSFITYSIIAGAWGGGMGNKATAIIMLGLQVDRIQSRILFNEPQLSLI